MSSHTLQEIDIDKVLPRKDNARKIDQKSESFKQLVNSIRSGGMQIPIHIWPHPKRKDKFEIRAGERRWKACKSLGHKTITAVVHEGITFNIAMTLTYVENKFRKPLEPLEEVGEIARAMNKLNDAKVIAELLGQTEQWVRLRANIHKNLIQGFKQAFASREQSEVFHSWTVGHLILIARLPAKCQKDILNNIKSYYWQWNNVSISDLNNRISNTLHLLSKAKWNLDDETLYPKAGSCTNCRMRSGTEPLLWFGAVSDQNKLKDRCLDLNCWRQKTKLYLQQRAKQLSAKHDDLAYISKEHLSRDEKQQLSETFGRVLDMDDIQKSTKGSKGTMPALIVHGNGTGDIMYVKQREFARPGGTGARAKGHVTPLKERRAMLKNKRWAQVLLDLREKVEAAKIESVVYKDRYTAVMALVAIYGNESTGIAAMYEQKEIEKIIAEKEKNPTAAYSMALTLLWESFKPTLDRILTYQGPVTQTTKHIIEQARWIAKLIQVDIDEVFKDVSQKKGFTEPKSWASLNPDGTPKTKAAKKTKKAMKVTKVKKTSKKKAS